MNRKELIKKIDMYSTTDIFEPYDCCQKGVQALVDSLEDNLLPSDYKLTGKEPLLIWSNGVTIQFTTRNTFRFTDKDGNISKGHQFGKELTKDYLDQLKTTPKSTTYNNSLYSKF